MSASEIQVKCESPRDTAFGVRPCTDIATHVYGPECERQSGNLMYLCISHAEMIGMWRLKHMDDPVECPTHGRIGKVRGSLILTPLSKVDFSLKRK